MAKEVTNTNVFVDALVSSRRATDLADVDDIFGFLVASWEVEAVLYDASGRSETRKGEVHASWVLEGRAIQDLFIFPRRADRPRGPQSETIDTLPPSEPTIARWALGGSISSIRRQMKPARN